VLQDCNGAQRFGYVIVCPHVRGGEQAYGDRDAASTVVRRWARPDQITMTEFSADGLIARLAPGVMDCFKGRGAVDFRVPPGEPDKLQISILFSHGLDPRGALADLKSVAERAGLPIADEQATEHSVSIAIPALRPAGAIVAPRGVILWVAPAATVVMSDDLSEGSYTGVAHRRHAGRSIQALFHRVSTAWLRWRALLLPGKPLQPAGVK
jgi:hypothetical protein